MTLFRDVFCVLTIISVTVIYPLFAGEASDSVSDMPGGGFVKVLHDYGLVAVAAIMLWANWRTQERMALALQNHEIQLIELVRQNAAIATQSTNEISQIRQQWQQRKCLADVPVRRDA